MSNAERKEYKQTLIIPGVTTNVKSGNDGSSSLVHA